MDLLGLITSGGVTGILGTVISNVTGYFTKKQELKAQESRQAHEVAMREMDAKIMAQEFAARTQIATVEADAKMDVAASEAFAKSFNEPQMYSAVNKSWSMTLLDFIRGIVRPGLTLYLAAVVTVMYFDAQRALAGAPADLAAITDFLNKTTDAIVYLASTAVLWWFGVRISKK